MDGAVKSVVPAVFDPWPIVTDTPVATVPSELRTLPAGRLELKTVFHVVCEDGMAPTAWAGLLAGDVMVAVGPMSSKMAPSA